MRIAHYAPNLWAPGGVSSWVRRVGHAQEARGDTVFYVGRLDHSSPAPNLHRVQDEVDLFAWARRTAVDVLHVHKALADTPPDELCVLRTLHDHSANCPSGSRHLARSDRPCDRVSGLATCMWGHVVDGCGSRRPSSIRKSFSRLRKERRTLQTLPMHAVSHHVKERMVLDEYDGDQIHVLHSPAPEMSSLNGTPPAESIPRFLFMGRIVPEKGLSTLLRALPRIDAPVHVDIAGDGYQRPGIEQLSQRLGVENQVTFHGWVSQDKIHALMDDARAVVFPSIWNEPAGLVSLEAAAAGRAVIASDVGGIPEYANTDFALLVPPGSPDRLANAMAQLATDHALAKSLGEQGRVHVREQFDVPTFLSGLDAIYEAARRMKSRRPLSQHSPQ